jgi:hypothetical protein
MRAVAMHMIGRAGKARAIAADDRLEGVVETAVVGIGGSEAFAGRLNASAQPVQSTVRIWRFTIRPAIITLCCVAVLAVDQLIDRDY